MKISKNDPRLTAYVLNELDALEKSMIEKALQADSELQNEVAQIKKSIGVFNTLAKSQVEMELSKAQREKIFERPSSARGWSIWTIGGSLATACLAVMLFQQKAHERPELPMPVTSTTPLSKTISATPPPPQAEAKKTAPAEVSAVADNFESDQPAALAESKSAEPQEYERAKNSMAGALGASGAGSATGSRADYGASMKSKSATAVARPTVAARMAKDEAAAPPAAAAAEAQVPASAPAQARTRPQELPLELDVSLSQFLPTESEPADVEINMNLTRDLKKCFSQNFSKYVRYNLKFRLNWNMLKMKPTNVQITDSMSTGLITAEIRSCVKQGFESQNWSEVKYIREALKPLQLEAVISIVSE